MIYELQRKWEDSKHYFHIPVKILYNRILTCIDAELYALGVTQKLTGNFVIYYI
jgi:hypothetical protein